MTAPGAQPRLTPRRAVRLLVRAIALVWSANRWRFVLSIAIQMAAGAAVGAQLLVGRAVLDAVLEAAARQGSFGDVAPEVALLAGITAAVGVGSAAQAGINRLLSEHTVRHVLDQILDVASAVDLESFERPAFFDRLRRAVQQGVPAPLQIAGGLGGLASGTVSVAAISVTLFVLEPVLVPIVLAGYAPAWIAATRSGRELYSFSYGNTPNDRARFYVQGVLTGRDSAKEVRAFDLAGFLRERWHRLYDERIADARALVRRILRWSMAASLATSAINAAAITVLVLFLLGGRMEIAAAATAAIAIQQLGSRLQAVGQGAATIYEQGLFLDDFTSFLGLGPTTEAEFSMRVPQRFGRVSIDGVHYRYPDAAVEALRGVDLELRAGEIVALVGENGSGKTTLAKLVCGLLQPAAGRIRWDETDIAQVDPKELRDSIAVVFQDFGRYQLPAHENIGVGRHERAGDRPVIEAAGRAAGADSFLRELPQGYDTLLSREFEGGVDLSVGQWQRMALARAFFRDAALIVLDEPTAALDPRAEADLFASIRDLCSGRTVLLISHRFSSVRTADRIYVLDVGAVTEHGTHEQLMSLGGTYAELFTLQARQYLDTPSG